MFTYLGHVTHFFFVLFLGVIEKPFDYLSVAEAVGRSGNNKDEDEDYNHVHLELRALQPEGKGTTHRDPFVQKGTPSVNLQVKQIYYRGQYQGHLLDYYKVI